MSDTSVYVPRLSRSRAPPPPLQETLQDQQVGLAQAPIKLLLLPLVLVCVILCVPFKSEVSVSPSPVELLQLSPIGFQSHMLWRLLFPGLDPCVGETDAQNSHSCGRTSAM